MGVVVEQFDVFLISLDPTHGAEIQKTRPCLIVSPDEMNRRLHTVIIAPLTSRVRRFPSRVDCSFEGKAGQIVLDQLRAVDNSRLIKRLGKIDEPTESAVLEVLAEMFSK